MTAETMAGTELLKLGEEDFNAAIKEITMKDLMETISTLQKEMTKEQENFNSLSSELQNIKERNSRQYKQISKDMTASQQKLTSLMNKSMKCFTQQSSHNSIDSPLKRRNSAKGPHPLTSSASVSTNIQRSKSLLAVNQSPSSDLSSPFHSPISSATRSQYSSNVSHVPVIMRATTNGAVTRPLKSAASNYTKDGNKEVTGGTISASASSKENELSSVKAEAKGVTDQQDKVNGLETGSSVSSKAPGNVSGGLYVKRNPAQQQRVTTTTNISSSTFLHHSQPAASSQVPEPASVPAFSTTTSALAATTPPTYSSHPTNTPSITLLTKSKPVVSQSSYVSPLQMAQTRKGISKSQNLTLDTSTNSESQGYRILPSVKLLAQSFGSSTALNVNPTPNAKLNDNRTNTFSGVYRSNSNLNLSEPQSSVSTTRIFLTKGSAAGVIEQTPQQETAAFVNGKPQQPFSVQLNRVPAPQNVAHSNSTNELEQIRTKLRSVGRDLDSENTPDSGNSTVTAPTSASVVKTEVVTRDENSAEGSRIGTYTKKKDAVPSKPPINVQPLTSQSVTVRSINSPTALASAKIAGRSQTAGPQSSSQKWSTLPPSHESDISAVVKQGGDTQKYSTLPHDQSKQQSNKSLQQHQSHPTASSSSSPGASFASLPSRQSGVGDRVVSSAAVNIRRAKSREELQEIENETRSNKGMLLKQIQAKRKDQETGGKGSNISNIGKLSQSMPSLLLEESDGSNKEVNGGSKSSPVKSSIVLHKSEKLTTDYGVYIDDGIEVEDEDKVPRMNLRDWDPNPVFSELYELKLVDEMIEDISHQFITMEGLMEKLPLNKRKATLLKTWKRRFFRAVNGWLYYYETSNRDQPSESIQLMGGSIHDIGTRVLGIDDGRGRFLMVRCPTEKEFGQWKMALESQTADNTKATYVRPVLRSPKHATKNVVIIDLGSSAVRAGILGQQASLPQLFFPSLVAVDKDLGVVVAVGRDALKPNIRHRCKIIHPIRPSNKVDQNIVRPFNIEVHLMRAIFEKVFKDLNCNPTDFWVMLSTPQSLGDTLKRSLMEILVDALKVKGVCMVQQALLSLYSYKATSGIIVDIGHRIEILPIFDGFVIEGGVARCPFGGQKVQESLTVSLLSNNYKFHSTTEHLLVRYIMEKSCYVAMDYGQEVEWCSSQSQTVRTNVNFKKFSLPEGSYAGVESDLSRFKSPEGFFNADMWEMDYPTLQKLVYQAIQTCPMDNRRHVWRAVFLSGGVTMLPGFAERLEKELKKLAPPGVPVEVHAAPQRYHAAYVGACSVALMPQFEGMAISKEEWKKDGVKSFRKWQARTS